MEKSKSKQFNIKSCNHKIGIIYCCQKKNPNLFFLPEMEISTIILHQTLLSKVKNLCLSGRKTAQKLTVIKCQNTGIKRSCFIQWYPIPLKANFNQEILTPPQSIFNNWGLNVPFILNDLLFIWGLLTTNNSGKKK